ncbi:hypothetical protein K458DRAFT_418916 [Lentithecium fluviatile CBS 122367]|uniref:Prion-inhibition and propagation HeLo domain-containing protein n=1 Tax=Lentithecium fluviatile CBS 122367 TaxID=1168545 RepID=A0A6G1IYE6_9PLEO|nr:hypothetical protein K458DRAFT_418916 [Lentithecium fluviatile CBS 122367]
MHIRPPTYRGRHRDHRHAVAPTPSRHQARFDPKPSPFPTALTNHNAEFREGPARRRELSRHKPRSFAPSHTQLDGRHHLTRHEHMNNDIDFSRIFPSPHHAPSPHVPLSDVRWAYKLGTPPSVLEKSVRREFTYPAMAAANENSDATTPKQPTKAEILTDVLSLATQFSTCVEAFNLIHPHKDSDHAQKVALAKLGIQQGRLLIFGDAVGISSPPKAIARHMIPSHPGATNPDPTLPVHFADRDPKLDDESINEKVRAALSEIEGRPSHLTREELMERYGLKTPKRFSSIEHPALDTNRLEAFREKYALLQDLVRQSGIRSGTKRSLSMTMSHWTVRDVTRFDEFVRTVKLEVDGLIALMSVKEQVDRGMRTDIKAMAWHPDLSGPLVRQDWEKLRLIREAVAEDYPEYVEVADKALQYIKEELSGSKLAVLRAELKAPASPTVRRNSADDKPTAQVSAQPIKQSVKTPDKEKRPGFLAAFRFKSWGKNSKGRFKSVAQPTSNNEDPQRSLSADMGPSKPANEDLSLEPVRSKSLSAIPDEPAPFNLDTRMHTVPSKQEEKKGEEQKNIARKSVESEAKTDGPEWDRAALDGEWARNQLTHADTANSLIDRHDMYKDVGRIETKDIRYRSKEAAGL